MALLKVGFNEGSLLRRTLVHVGTFVAGSMAFVGLVSFVLVSIAKGLVPPTGAATDDTVESAADADPSKPGKLAGAKPVRKKTTTSTLPSVDRPGKND